MKCNESLNDFKAVLRFSAALVKTLTQPVQSSLQPVGIITTSHSVFVCVRLELRQSVKSAEMQSEVQNKFGKLRVHKQLSAYF